MGPDVLASHRGSGYVYERRRAPSNMAEWHSKEAGLVTSGNLMQEG